MSNVEYKTLSPDTGAIPRGVVIETEQQGDGSQRQVVKVGGSVLPDGAATSANQTNKAQMTQITNGTDQAQVMTGYFTGEKGLRVFIGPTDPVSDLPVFVDYNHHQNHEGEAYQYTYPLTALANNATVYFRLVVPTYAVAMRSPHLYISADVLAQTIISLYEAPTTSGNGTLQSTIRNRNRNSANTPGMTIYLAPTVTTPGTLLTQHTIGDAGAGVSSEVAFDEWILANNTVYLISITAQSTGDSVGLRLKWYEDLGV